MGFLKSSCSPPSGAGSPFAADFSDMPVMIQASDAFLGFGDLDFLDLSIPGLSRVDVSPRPTESASSTPEEHPLLPLQADDASDPNQPNEGQATPFCYSIVWKLAVKKGQRLSWLADRTEDGDISASPEVYWRATLKAKLANVLEAKAPNSQHQPEETTFVLSVKYRSAVRKFYTEQNICWPDIEEQLQAWSHHVRERRQVEIKITFVYKEVGTAAGTVNNRQGSRRGATASQRAEIDAIRDERRVTGRIDPWPEVYNLTRCPDQLCNTGAHCWLDENNKHHRLSMVHLGRLVYYVKAGNRLESMQDIPQDLIEQLRQQGHEAHRGTKRKNASDSPVRINVFPASVDLGQGPVEEAAGLSVDAIRAAIAIRRPARPKIPGLRDQALTSYREWLWTSPERGMEARVQESGVVGTAGRHRSSSHRCRTREGGR